MHKYSAKPLPYLRPLPANSGFNAGGLSPSVKLKIMFIYKNNKTRQIAKREERDEELENSDEWEFVVEYKNGRLNNYKIVTK